MLGLTMLCLNLGCQTNELKAYDRLKVGMDKGEVIGIMGSPRRSERWQGQDRWTYEFYHQDQPYSKEIRFSEGKSTYVGEIVKPAVSAEEQDLKNETENKALEAQWQQERADKRAQSSKFMNNEEVSTQIRYVPTFRPVQ